MLCRKTYSKCKGGKKKALIRNREKALPKQKITKRNTIIPSFSHLMDSSLVEFNLWLPQNTTQSLNYKSQPYTDDLNPSVPLRGECSRKSNIATAPYRVLLMYGAQDGLIKVTKIFIFYNRSDRTQIS